MTWPPWMKPISESASVAEGGPARLKGRALAWLTQREHSRAELAQKLARLGAAAEEIAPLLAELAERDLQSDSRFADAWVMARVRRGYGPAVIRQELQARGIEAELVAAALQALETEWPGLARAALVKKFGRQVVDKDPKERARRWRFLRYRGFDGAALRQALGATGDELFPDEAD